MKSLFSVVCCCLVSLVRAEPPVRTQGVVSFLYDGKAFLCDRPVAERELPRGRTWRSHAYEYRTPDGRLGVRVTWKFYDNYDAAEYVPELYAVGTERSGLVTKLASLDLTREDDPSAEPDAAPVRMRALVGDTCSAEAFTPADRWITDRSTVTFSACGRSSDGQSALGVREGGEDDPLTDARWLGDPEHRGAMPFFALDFPSGDGLEIAVGWSGSWRVDCTKWKRVFRLKAGLRKTHFRVLPGETLRAPSIVLWRRPAHVGPQAFRTVRHRFMREEKLPRDGSGRLIRPLLALTFGGGNRPVSQMFDQLSWCVTNSLPFDTFWVDAGWNGPAHVVDTRTNCGPNWPDYLGTWTFNPLAHPDGSFSRLSAAAHSSGRRFLQWCEIERVRPGTTLAALPDACLLKWERARKGEMLLNLGEPTAWQKAVDTVENLIRISNLDVYRQDFNVNPAPYWRANDAADRVGVTEMKYVDGLYRFWDRLRRDFPDLLIENCSSGGRRLDIELISRSHSYCRSDYFIQHHGDNQVFAEQDATLNTLEIQPYQGSETRAAKVGDDYAFFSSVCAGSVFTPLDWGFYRDGGFTAEELAWFKRMFAVADRMRTYFEGDFHPLTARTDIAPDKWCAYQLHRTDLDAGFVLVFRRPKCESDTFAPSLGGLDPSAEYALEEWNGGCLGRVCGEKLKTRAIKVPDPRGFSLVFYRKVR